MDDLVLIRSIIAELKTMTPRGGDGPEQHIAALVRSAMELMRDEHETIEETVRRSISPVRRGTRRWLILTQRWRRLSMVADALISIIQPPDQSAATIAQVAATLGWKVKAVEEFRVNLVAAMGIFDPPGGKPGG